MQFSGKKLAKSALALATFYAASGYALDVGKVGDTSISVKGYVKLDAMATSYSDYADDDNVGAGGWKRDFYVPSATPVGSDKSHSTMDFHARQSRFGIGTKTDVDGNTVSSYIELGFQTTIGGNELVTSSYVPRIRHAFLTYNNWLFGQTWSTFMDVSGLPETLDFVGNTDAMIFVRQSQIRYTAGSFQFALENPETYVGSANDDNTIPDIVVRYNGKGDRFNWSMAGIYRQLKVVDVANDVDESASGFGIAFTGVLKVGERDDLKLVVNTGSGLGRYLGLAVAQDAYMDGDSLETIDTTAFNISYRHFWSETTRSTFSYATNDIDAQSGTESTTSIRANLLFSPVKNLTLGGELAFAERDVVGDVSGDMSRLQFSAKLAF